MLRQEFVGLLWVIEKGSLEQTNLKFKKAHLVTSLFVITIIVNMTVTMFSINLISNSNLHSTDYCR